MGDLVEHEPASTAVGEYRGESGNLLASIVAAARDPAVDAGKMEAMANLALKLQAHEQEQQFNRDLNAALIAMPVITKAGRIEIPANPDKGTPARVQGHFARFEDLNAVVKPILAANNLAITFDLGSDERGVPNCIPILRHTNGWVWTGRALSAPIDSSGSKNNTQGVGSTTSYLKRYTMCAALNIVVESEDDDANGGQVLMPNERGNLIIEAAQAAFDENRYTEWYSTQSPKDRAWLVQSGKHAEYGGPALPPPTARTGAPPPSPPPSPPPPAGKSALEQRVEQYEADLAACTTLEDLQALQTERAPWAEQVKAKRPELHERIVSANSLAYQRISGALDGEPEAESEDGEPEEGTAPGTDARGDLFAGGEAEG